MNVQQVYDKYTIPPNLQKHMLRVAALSQIIMESWNSPSIDKGAVVFTCLFHDMANIIKFDFSKPSLFKEEDVRADYWKKIQLHFVEKYGPHVHDATQTIAKEAGLAPHIVDLIAKLEWDNAMKVVETHNFESALTIYCDMRMGPYGILPLKERLDNLKTRAKSNLFAFYEKAGPLLEKMIQQHTQITLNSIQDVQLDKQFKTLLNLKIDNNY